MTQFQQRGKAEENALSLPIPVHLQKLLHPVGNNNSERKVDGKIICPCGNKHFEVKESNSRQILKIICNDCKEEFVLFDSGKHGWDGYVCGVDFLDREKPLEQAFCPECGEGLFRIALHISSLGKEDFAEECLANDASFSSEDWVNAFEWITISLSCTRCGFNETMNFETM